MRILPIVLVLNLFAVHAAAAATRPDDVFGIVDTGSLATEITGVQAALTKNFPGTPPITLDSLPTTLGQMVGLTKLDGVATNKPLHAIFLNPVKYTPPLLLVVPVANAAALNASVATGANLVAHIKGGYAIIGTTAAVTAVEGFGASLEKMPARAGLHVVAFVQPIWAAFGAQFVAVRQMVGGMMSSQKDALVSADTVNSMFDQFEAAVVQTDEFHIDASTSGTQLVLAFAVKAKTGTAIDRFIAAQRPSTFAGLDHLAAGLAPMVAAGTIVGTPESGALLRSLMATLGKITDPAKMAPMVEFQKLWSGDMAFGFDIPKPNVFSMQSITTMTDAKRGVEIYRDVYKLTDGSTSAFMTTTRTDKPPYSYSGLTVTGQTVVQQMNKNPPAGSKPIPKIVSNVQWTGFDHSFLTVAESDAAGATDRMHKLIDAAHDNKNALTLPPLAQASLQRAKAAKATFWSYFDLDKVAAASGKPPKTPLPDIAIVMTNGDHVAKMTTTLGE